MRTAEETAQHLQVIITNIYLHPAMYGETVAGVEQALWIYHATWAYVTERDGDYFKALADAGDAAGSGVNSFHSACLAVHPGAPEPEVLEFVLKHWATVTVHLGIPLPAEYPDPMHAFSPNTGQPQSPPSADQPSADG